MLNRYFGLVFFVGVSLFLSVGCATTRAVHPSEKADAQAQIAALQSELQAKDQETQDLRDQLDSHQQSLGATSNISPQSRNSIVRVSGVSIKDVQRALTGAGLDPGPVDGRPGKKTKSAIQKFQKKNNLTPDGIVGAKTWALLKS